MKFKRPFFIFLISIALAHSLSAQDITLTAEAPQKVYERDYIVLKYTINTEMKDYSPELTFPPELKVQFGPHVFRSRTILSGVFKHITTYSYNLLASQPGIYPLPSLSIEVNGQTYTSEALTVEVMKNDATSPKDLFLEAKLGRPSVSVNQMVRYTVKLYATGSTNGLSGVELVPPAFDGFSVKQVMLPEPKPKRVTYNGRTAYSYKLAEYWLFPEHPDTLTIEPASVQLNVAKNSIEKNVTIQSPALHLVVEPLPADAPADFSGLVGSFFSSASIDTTTVKKGEAVNISYKVTGTGNLDLLQIPELIAPKELEITSDETETDIEIDFERIGGSRTFTYTIVPRKTGKFELRLPGLAWFSTNRKTYDREEDAVFTVTVR